MGKCNACGYCQPHPGEQTCRFYKDAREKARAAGDEDSWNLYLDTDTLEDLQVAELAKSGEKGNLDVKPLLPGGPNVSQEQQIKELTRRMDTLTDKLQGFLRLQAQPVPIPSVLSTTAPFVTSQSPAITISWAGVPLYSMSALVTTVAATAGHAQFGLFTSPVSTLPSHVHVQPMVSHAVAPPSMPMPAASQSAHIPVLSRGHSIVPPASGVATAAYPQGGQPYGHAPSSWLPDPLTSALHQLLTMADPDANMTAAGMPYRPEYHALHKLENVPVKELDHRKLTFKQLIYGMTCVARHVRASGGDIDSYLLHMEFVSRHASDNTFVDGAYAEYDRYVIDNFLKMPTMGFKTADSIAIGYAFHPGKMSHFYSERSSTPVKQKHRLGKKSSTSHIPDGYPEGKCFF